MVLEIKPKEEKNSLTYIIQNFVVKARLPIEDKLDLTLLDKELNNSQYNSNRFPGLFIRFKNPKCVIIVFRNGKLVLTGLKSSKDIELVMKKLIIKLEEIKTIRILKKKIEYEIVNIVVTANFFREIDLDAATIKLRNSIYEPEVFPGVIYNSPTSIKSVFLIFSTGKIVVTGLRNEETIESILVSFGRLLKEEDLFKKS
ncbi:MAG: TATA-box-binding protein [Candidatus Thorarchaeota archaeon]